MAKHAGAIMSEFVFPFKQDGLGTYSRADHVAVRGLCNAVAETKVYVADNGTADPHDGIATDTLYNLDVMR